MTSKELSKLIREFVRKEIEHQKAEIIKEVKAEMFDALMARNIEPQLQTESVQVGTGGTGTPTAADMTRESLREMFTSKLGMDTDSFNFNTENVQVDQPPALPQSFNGGSITEKHQEVFDVMNKDYGQLMKKMGI
jgi:formate-dependent phosphoribosylglycinamide formyltransferase (GAR transformylase)